MNSQPYRIKLNLAKTFLEATHNHRVLNATSSTYGAFYSVALKNCPDVDTIAWGGLNGTQFHSIEELTDFLSAFSELLKKYKISPEHNDNLLYFITIFDEKTEEDSLTNNEYNGVLELSKMLIDLFNIKLTDLKPQEERVFYDTKSGENYIVTDEMIERIPEGCYTPELFKSIPVNVIVDDQYSKTKLVPHDLSISFRSSSIRYNTKRMPIEEIKVPASHVQAITELIIKYSLDQAKKLNAPIYTAFKQGKADKDALKQIYESRRIKKPSWNDAIVRVGIVIRDYLQDHTSLKSWYKQANFLFEYFSLFKVYRPKKEHPNFPAGYDGLVRYYKMCGMSYKSIATMFRDSNIK